MSCYWTASHFTLIELVKRVISLPLLYFARFLETAIGPIHKWKDLLALSLLLDL